MIITKDIIITDEKEIKTVNKSTGGKKAITVIFKDNSKAVFESSDVNGDFEAIKKAIK